MCIFCELKKAIEERMVNRITPQEGMRGYNEELDLHFEIFDNAQGFHRILANDGEMYAIRSDKIKVLLV